MSKSSKKMEIDAFLDEVHTSLGLQGPSSQHRNAILTNASNNDNSFPTARPGKVIHDNIDETSQHLAQLCNKSIDAEDRANRANQEEILCWCLYWKDFRARLDVITRKDKLAKRKREAYFMIPLWNSLVCFASKDPKK
ncbi:unnamed protein product [Rhizophagus irregularis]|nr:unnamed protein product [Rhizophagus irregularis]